MNLLIFLQPFQKEQIKITQKFKIPNDIEPGRYSLFIGGRDFIDFIERRLAPGKFVPQDFAHLLTLLNDQRKNNNLIIQLRKPAKGTLLKGQEFSSLPPSI